MAGQRVYPEQRIGEVAKRSNAADCKSVGLAPSKVRVLPSPSSVEYGQTGEGRRKRASTATERTESIGLFVFRLFVFRLSGLQQCGSNSVVESQPSKLLVAGSIPVSRSNMFRGTAPLGLSHAVTRAAWRPRCVPAGAPTARLSYEEKAVWG